MADIDLTQVEADELIAMEKHSIDDDSHAFPMGGKLTIALQSPDKREQFLLDVSTTRIDLRKGTYQNRARQAVILVRLDFGGAPHRNPDDEGIPCPHLHRYREGYGDKWATPLPGDTFPRISDLGGTLDDFMRYCNITLPPRIERGLFV